jgi:hypothetical protein
MSSLKKNFMQKMIGPLTGLAAGLAVAVTGLAPTEATAQERPTTQQDINDFASATVQFAEKYPNISPAQAAAIHDLYAEMQEFYLADPTRPNPDGFLSDITNHAGVIAERYGLGYDRLYVELQNSIGLHSLFSETFLTLTQQNMGQNLELADFNNEDFVGMKLQAMIDVQFRLARFVEESSKLLAEDDNLPAATFASFSTVCHLARRFEERMQDIQTSVLPQNGYTVYPVQMSVEDPATGYNQPLDCNARPGR